VNSVPRKGMARSDPWPEEEYLRYLAGERHLFAWTLEKYDGFAAPVAKQRAFEFYPQKPPTDRYRCLVFHDLAWHWAMLQVFGEQYWIARPDLEQPGPEYLEESQRWEADALQRR
jgi:hypothetical protein